MSIPLSSDAPVTMSISAFLAPSLSFLNLKERINFTLGRQKDLASFVVRSGELEAEVAVFKGSEKAELQELLQRKKTDFCSRLLRPKWEDPDYCEAVKMTLGTIEEILKNPSLTKKELLPLKNQLSGFIADNVYAFEARILFNEVAERISELPPEAETPKAIPSPSKATKETTAALRTLKAEEGSSSTRKLTIRDLYGAATACDKALKELPEWTQTIPLAPRPALAPKPPVTPPPPLVIAAKKPAKPAAAATNPHSYWHSEGYTIVTEKDWADLKRRGKKAEDEFVFMGVRDIWRKKTALERLNDFFDF